MIIDFSCEIVIPVFHSSYRFFKNLVIIIKMIFNVYKCMYDRNLLQIIIFLKSYLFYDFQRFLIENVPKYCRLAHAHIHAHTFLSPHSLLTQVHAICSHEHLLSNCLIRSGETIRFEERLSSQIEGGLGSPQQTVKGQEPPSKILGGKLSNC